MANPTTYYRPKSLEEAAELLRQPDALSLAGGALTLGTLDFAYPVVIDVQDVPELREIDGEAGGASFGSAVTLEQVLAWEYLPDVFRRALTRTLSPNLRNNVTVLESLQRRGQPLLRDWLAALTAHDVGVGALEQGVVNWDSLVTRLADRNLDDRFITGIMIPSLPEQQALGSAYVARTPRDAAIVNAAVYVYLDDGGRVESVFTAICGASPESIRMITLDTLIGNPLDDANIASAVKRVAPQIDPVGDYLGSAEYRQEMARVTVQRALLECMTQWGG